MIVILGCTGCGTVVEEQRLQTIEVTPARRTLDPRDELSVRPTGEEADSSLVVESTKICRTAIESVLQRELVTTRRIERSWYFPAPVASGSSVSRALAVAAYAATVGLIDKLRTSERREPVEAMRRLDGIHEEGCGTIAAADIDAELFVLYPEPTPLNGTFAWGALRPRQHVLNTAVQTDRHGRVKVRLPEMAAFPAMRAAVRTR